MSLRTLFCILAVLPLVLGTADVYAQETPITLPAQLDDFSQDMMDVLDHEDRADMFVPAAEPVTDPLPEDLNTNTVTTHDDFIHIPSAEPTFTLPNPTYIIEDIRITGNYQFSKTRILALMEIQEGEEFTLEQLEDARLKLMVSGLFQTVELRLYPGSERQKLELDLLVDERSPFQVNQYFIGTSQKSPFWMGLDVSWLAPFATSHRFRLGFVATTTSDYSLKANYFIPSIGHTPVSLMFSVESTQGHENIYGRVTNPTPTQPRFSQELGELAYEKHGGSISAGYSILPDLRLTAQLEYMNLQQYHELPTYSAALNTYLQPDQSHLTAFAVNLMYDTRTGKLLPNAGHMVFWGLKGTARTVISNYAYIKMHFAHQSNWTVAPQHILRLNTFGGFVFGNAPFFEKFFYNDFYALGTSRVLGLNPSNRGAYDLFHTGTSGLGYEDFLVHAGLSYVWQPKAHEIELFVTANVTWADSYQNYPLQIAVRPQAERGVFPIDLSVNAGARFKTDYGLFSITIGNVLDLAAR